MRLVDELSSMCRLAGQIPACSCHRLRLEAQHPGATRGGQYMAAISYKNSCMLAGMPFPVCSHAAGASAGISMKTNWFESC